jgi:hypothetical protein
VSLIRAALSAIETKSRFQLGQERIEIGEHLPDLLAAPVHRRRDRTQRLIEFRGLDLRQHRRQLLEDRVDLDHDV